MKQTSVEWLQKKLIESGISFLSEEIEYINQAKEMYKEQMIEFANSFYDECGMQYGGLEKSAEEYYKETYEK
jgi:hypothetical protein